ncbi:SH3 domain-containing protein [Deinococcus carri]|uniref:SH3 domain-containing protein n=1 Tax=Deinococcus carri TaxID=1211323 RepID=UPI003CD0535A
MKRTLLFSTASVLFMLFAPAQAHRDGCHRWHSCPSDHGTYVCGDLGYTSGCPTSERPQPVAVPATPAAPPVSGSTRRTTTSLNLREGPSAQTGKVATLAAGTQVNLLGCAAGWCKVSTKGRTGYVSQKYLR